MAVVSHEPNNLVDSLAGGMPSLAHEGLLDCTCQTIEGRDAIPSRNPHIRQTRMIRNSEWYSITGGLSVTFDKYLPIHTSNFLDLITDKFMVVSSSCQKMGQFFSSVLERTMKISSVYLNQIKGITGTQANNLLSRSCINKLA